MRRSKNSIGDKNVDRYIAEQLNPEGFLSAKAGRTTRFGGEDFFGKAEDGPGFDILSLCKDEILLTQVKTNQARSTYTNMKAWLLKNKDNIPERTTMRLAVLMSPSKTKPERWLIRDMNIEGGILYETCGEIQIEDKQSHPSSPEM